LLGVSGEFIGDATAYMRIQLIGIVTLTSVTVAQSIMQSSGDTFTPMKISIGYRLLQMALCPGLVFGWWIFPQWGVSGASLSNVVAQGVGGGIALWYLFNGRSRIHITLRKFQLDLNIIWRTIKIGIPASISYTERAFADLILVGFITSFGTFAVAAHSLAQRIDQFVQNLGGGFGTPAAVLAGQNMGARRPDRAARTGWLAVGLATAVAISFCIIIWLWVEPILGIFSADPETVKIAATFLKIQTAGYLVWGLVVVLSLVLNGVGDTLVMMFTNLLTMWGVQIALAYFLSRHTSLGVYGIRWAIVTGIMVRGIIYPAYFASGRWKRKRV